MDRLRAIEYFNRTVEAGSFTAAARSFDVSTPAVTQSIASLEKSLGVVLFHRTPRGVSLTKQGDEYYSVSRQVTASLQSVEERLAARGTKPRGTLTVALYSSLGQNCVMPRIALAAAR